MSFKRNLSLNVFVSFCFIMVSCVFAGSGVESIYASSTGITRAVAKPVVTTSAATLITAESAQLNGTVNPNSGSTTYYFEYGLTAAYGLKTDNLNAGSGTVGVVVSANLVGFTAGTTYHFRLIGTNSAGTTYGSDKTFITTALPKPVVTTGTATSVTATTATLNGTVNPNGSIASYYFQYGTTTSYGFTTRNPRSGSERASFTASKSISGLSQNTTYHFRIVATNSAGTTYGTDKIFTTPIKPTVITGTPTSVTDTTAILNGTVNPNGTATTCYFQYGTTTSYGKKTPTQSKAAGTTSTSVMAGITGFVANTTYHFQLVATNSAGTTYGLDRTFITIIEPIEPNEHVTLNIILKSDSSVLYKEHNISLELYKDKTYKATDEFKGASSYGGVVSVRETYNYSGKYEYTGTFGNFGVVYDTDKVIDPGPIEDKNVLLIFDESKKVTDMFWGHSFDDYLFNIDKGCFQASGGIENISNQFLRSPATCSCLY